MVLRSTRREVLRTIGAAPLAGSLVGTAAATTNGGDELWRYDHGSGNIRSSPTIVDGAVYAAVWGRGSISGVIAVDAADGDLRWHNDELSGGNGAAHVVGETVYVQAGRYTHALDAGDGERLWDFSLGDGRTDRSPVVVDDVVYVPAEELLALESEARGPVEDTPERIWEILTPGSCEGLAVAGETVYVTSNVLSAYDRKSRREEWVFEFDNATDSVPTVADGTVYVGDNDGFLYGIDADTGDEEWRFEAEDDVDTVPTAADGVVYAADTAGYLYAVNAASGDEEWRFETGEWIASSPTIADGVVYVGSGDGHLYAVNAETGDEEWRFETGDSVRSSPTVADGVVYVGSDDNTLYAIETDGDGSSEGSRVALATLGHHDGWTGDSAAFGSVGGDDGSDDDGANDADGGGNAGADDGADGGSDDTGGGDDEANGDGDGSPGFGLGAAVAGVGGAAYLLSRRFDDDR